ncbi:hypothetical protein PBPRA1644 [Photobacterium profundum SS9]|uniref:Uncharacterized protein n=1 Tax=Photobacterium profundum (strain SS9) TaxID=298386 RepID=Q6LRM1_PHOPR|nr:hypothetical protein PBPRA1644 [Photobacterium profundum SS9]
MNAEQQFRADYLYEQQLTNLKLQGKRPVTLDANSRAVRRIIHHFDKAPDTYSYLPYRLSRPCQSLEFIIALSIVEYEYNRHLIASYQL